jgi:deoxycytidylate deaminase
MKGPCAKATVRARLILSDGTEIIGINSVQNPQKVCPRIGHAEHEARDQYALCQQKCRQPFHAEMAAIDIALKSGRSLEGSRMIIHHKRICGDCEISLREYGVPFECVGVADA